MSDGGIITGSALAASGLTGLLAGRNNNSQNEALLQNQSVVNGTINQMQSLLNGALNNAISQNTGYTTQAISNLQNNYIPAALNSLNSGLTNATNAATTNTNNAINSYRALQGPYSTLGYNAADMYADSLGLARPAIGSANLANSMFNYNNTINPQLQALQTAATNNGGANPFATPAQQQLQALQPLVAAPTQQQIDAYVNNWQRQAMASAGYNSNPSVLRALSAAPQAGAAAMLNPIYAQNNAIQANNNAINQANQNKIGLFNNQQNAYNTLQNTLNNVNPQYLQQALAASQGMFNPSTMVNVGLGGAV